MLLAVALTTTTVLFAEKKNPSDPAEPPPPDLFRQDKAVFSVHPEFLFWKPVTGALMYALDVNKPTWNPNDTYPVGDYKTITYGFDPGFRFALSYFRAPRYWEIYGMYTRLTSRGSASARPSSGFNDFLSSTWPTYFDHSVIYAKSKIHLNYNVVDLNADRYFVPNPHLRLRLAAGFTGAWMNQSWTVRYFDFNNHVSFVRNCWEFGGGGFRVGMVADWFWTHDIYITLRGTLASLVGAYKNTMYQTTSIQPTNPNGTPNLAYNPGVPYRNATYSDVRAVAHLQFILGPSWQKNWSTFRMEVFGGYEINSWGNLQEVYFAIPGVPASSVQQTWINTSLFTLQGLTTRVSLDF